MNLKEALTGKLTQKEMNFLRTSYDVVGDIAIIEIPKELKKREKLIGQTILALLHNIKTVAAAGEHTGKYRTQKLRIIAGQKRFETTQKESGITLKVDVAKCYYSPRLGSERLRIAKLVKKREKILVVGSGIAPYPLVLAKYTPAQITAVEVNPTAHKYAIENVKINKLGHKITLVKGDIRKIKLGKFDRIISAIPHEGIKLVPALLKFAKKGTKLHIYDFASEQDLEEPARKLKLKSKTVKTQQVGIRRYRVCIDAVI
ncbi:tRNA (guanine(37)-N1)-methyltransferase Trm5a [uncultured archaeon]|nr:tRNA (guanine(37)-N1)-methyltransferase Trm5a [uncultured archaeon]